MNMYYIIIEGLNFSYWFMLECVVLQEGPCTHVDPGSSAWSLQHVHVQYHMYVSYLHVRTLLHAFNMNYMHQLQKLLARDPPPLPNVSCFLETRLDSWVLAFEVLI